MVTWKPISIVVAQHFTEGLKQLWACFYEILVIMGITKKTKKQKKYAPGTDVHVRIFWKSYCDTSWELTRENEEEKMEF